ncbi:MAG: hypothetical protein IT328_23030 [Caldilineaceae bacterium]|nr:hypothetical protein [Caldilineaceae bacterium]
MSTTYYRMESTYHGTRLTITNFDRKPYEQTHELTDASFDRFTAIAEKAAEENHPGRTFELLRSNEGFGWELTSRDHRPCPTCGRVIVEYEKEYATDGDCFMCKLDKKIQAEREVEQAEIDRIITAPMAPRPELQPDEHGDFLYA